MSINALIAPAPTGGYDLAYAEYEEGDYQRSFRLSGEVDRDKIEAVVRESLSTHRRELTIAIDGVELERSAPRGSSR